MARKKEEGTVKKTAPKTTTAPAASKAPAPKVVAGAKDQKAVAPVKSATAAKPATPSKGASTPAPKAPVAKPAPVLAQKAATPAKKAEPAKAAPVAAKPAPVLAKPAPSVQPAPPAIKVEAPVKKVAPVAAKPAPVVSKAKTPAVAPKKSVSTAKAPVAKTPAAKKPAATRTPARKTTATAKAKAVPAPKKAPVLAVAPPAAVAKVVPAPASAPRPSAPPAFERELPLDYGETKVVVLVRDPEWAFAYWEIAQPARAEFGIPRGSNARPMALRIYDVTDIHFDGANAHSFFDVSVNDYATSWYLRLPESARSYVVDLGVYDEDGNFLRIARSNAITAPPAGMSPYYADEQWMKVTDEQFAEIFRMSGGLRLREVQTGGSIDLLRRPSEEMLLELRRQWVGSGSMWSGASALLSKPVSAKGFWLKVDCEVIVYGATEPDAKVTLQGRPIQLSPDGTFHARFAFPDGVIELPVRAVNNDGDEVREITPVVSRKTS